MKYSPLFFILLSLVIGVVAIIVLPDFPVISDSADYNALGQLISEDVSMLLTVVDDTVQPPLYPLVLGGLYALFGVSHTIVFLFQFLLVGLIGYIIFRIAHDHLNLPFRISILAGLVVLFWPYMILFSLLIRTEILFIFLFILSLWFLLQGLRLGLYKDYAFAGAIIGLASLTRPVVLLLPFWLAGIAILYRLWKRDLSFTWIRPVIIGIVVFVLILFPWVAITSLKFGRFIPVAGNLSAVIEKGNVNLEYLEGVKNTSLRDVMSAKLQNIYLFWNPGAGGYRAERVLETYPSATILLWVYRIGFFLLLGFASLAFNHKKNMPVILLGITILYFWTLHIVTFPYPRYMLPVVPMVIVLAIFSFYRFYFSKDS